MVTIMMFAIKKFKKKNQDESTAALRKMFKTLNISLP